MTIQDLLDRLEVEMLRNQFPDRPVADWRNTNHYEIHNPEVRGGYWWLDCWEALGDPGLSELTIPRERLGLVLDLACAAPALIREIYLLRDEIALLREALGEIEIDSSEILQKTNKNELQ